MIKTQNKISSGPVEMHCREIFLAKKPNVAAVGTSLEGVCGSDISFNMPSHVATQQNGNCINRSVPGGDKTLYRGDELA